MYCKSCGKLSSGGGDHCKFCGAAFSETPLGYASANALTVSPKVAVYHCQRCGQSAPAERFFSRGWNVGKAILLAPVFMGLPIAYFFIRKDRLICRYCRGLLPESAVPTGYLAHDGSGRLIPAQGSVGIRGHSGDAAALMAQSKQKRRRGLFWAVVAAPTTFFTAAAMMGGDAAAGEAIVMSLPMVISSGLSLLSFRRASQLNAEAKETESRAMERAVLTLAAKQQGRLNVTEVATHVGLSLKEAELLLDSMVDGTRVDLEVSDAGLMTYVFPELATPRALPKA